jgi:4-amino-4-deoxy-L-arabinose transferase-like glycosyltransferase
MGDTHDDPTDHSRTTQPHAGIAMKDNFLWPGLVLLVVATFGLISTAAAAAYRHYEWLAATVLIAVLGAVAGALWLVMEYRRVIRIEAQWDAAHPVVGRASRASVITTGEHPVDGSSETAAPRNVSTALRRLLALLRFGMPKGR